MNGHFLLFAICIAVITADAGVRVIHASPDAPAVDVFVNSTTPTFSNLAFTENTGAYTLLPANVYNIKVSPTGATTPVVINATLPLADGVYYTIAAAGFLADIEALVFVDEVTTNSTLASVRFIHLAPDAPAVDVAVQNSSTLFSNVSFSESGGYVSVPEGTYDLEVLAAGTTTQVLAVPGVSLMAGTVYTVFAEGTLNQPEYPLQAVLTVDAAPSSSPVEPDDNDNTRLIIIICVAVGAVLLIIVTALVAYFCCIRKRGYENVA
mmetsp:Transcript_27606/g.30737  ORF Transcript_27606/g.30737 Transcript_27606/m.30737 type:complete len:265 (+) Transcript_27606:66-860(+)